jgi:hypothetical protein
MAIQYKKNTAIFSDVISVEDAEALLEWLQKNPKGRVDLAACTHLHAANLQVLMAARVPVSAWPQDSTLTPWLSGAMDFRKESTHV